MLADTEKRFYTTQEYLELEEKAEFRSEYRDGEIIHKPGGTTNHNKIVGNFYKRFPLTIEQQNYDIYLLDVRLWIPDYRSYTYPDVMIIQGEPVYHSSGTSIVTNPCLIVEVLSKSTRDYDRSDKFKAYRSIPEFKEYILLEQYSFYGEQYIKQNQGEWLLKIYECEEAILSLSTINFKISFKELYQRVNFNIDEES